MKKGPSLQALTDCIVFVFIMSWPGLIPEAHTCLKYLRWLSLKTASNDKATWSAPDISYVISAGDVPTWQANGGLGSILDGCVCHHSCSVSRWVAWLAFWYCKSAIASTLVAEFAI